MPEGMPGMGMPGMPGAAGMPMPGAGAPPPPGAGNTPPMGAPMSTQEPAEGLKQSARVNAHIAMTLLEQSLPGLGSESPEGQAVLTALRALSKVADEQPGAKELVPAELQQLLQSAPGAGGGAGGGMPPVGMPPPGAGGGMPGGMPGGM